MIIAHYMPGMWHNGGISTYIRRLSEAQQAAGHHVLFFDLATVVEEKDRRDGTTHCNGEHAVAEAARHAGAQVLHVHRDFPVEHAGNLPVIRTIHDHIPYCPSGGRYLKRPDKPCNRVYSVGGCLWGHVVDRCGSARPASLLRSFTTTRRELRRLPHITTLVSSRFVREQMVRQGYDPTRLIRLPMPAPPALPHISPPPRSSRFVFMGRLVPHKGLAWLLHNLSQMDASVTLDVAGEGNELEALKSLAARLNLRNRAKFHGWLNHQGIERLIDDAVAVIVPSRWHEPFGLVSLEAMARGRPVIASDTGALPEVVIDGHTGLIVPTTVPEGLAVAMRKLIVSPDLAAEMGSAGWRRVSEQYSMDDHLRGVLDAYRIAGAA